MSCLRERTIRQSPKQFARPGTLTSLVPRPDGKTAVDDDDDDDDDDD
jgi:hypothetical protein